MSSITFTEDPVADLAVLWEYDESGVDGDDDVLIGRGQDPGGGGRRVARLYSRQSHHLDVGHVKIFRCNYTSETDPVPRSNKKNISSGINYIFVQIIFWVSD